MAGSDDDQERTESPSQKRLDDARSKGDVPRSRDLGAAAVVLTAGIGLKSVGAVAGARLLALMHDGLSITGADAVDEGRMLAQFGHESLNGLMAIAPLMGLLLAAAVLAPLAIGGWTFSTQALAPDFGRLNPGKGLARMFSSHGWIELCKSLARFVVVALVAVMVLKKQFHSFSGLGAEAPRAAIGHALSLIGSALVALGGALGAIALVDAPLAIWQHHKKLRMSRQEVRDEHKDADGNPEMKSRVRRAQQASARRRMMQDVPKADVVITNPTHYAVALRYDDTRMRAPVVVAKGRDLIALRIREIAAEHHIALVEAPPLARALHAGCDLGEEVPARLYAAVAKIMVYVYQLRTARREGASPPAQPSVELLPE
jgi:flagellar biosynthetic protein FlhB